MDPQMTPERYARVSEIVADALQIEPNLRERFLQESCKDDDVVRREAGALLDFEDTQIELEKPIFEALQSPPQVSWEGRRVGRYRILKSIGEGGMGSVFLARREGDDFDMEVALKVVRPGRLQTETLRRFHEERRILARLEHPNIARLLDGGASDIGPYFAMEYVEGRPIDRYCEDHQLPVRRRLELFRQVCSAVQEAHRYLLVHRDIKASNILVTPEGVPKLIDFGIAMPADEGEHAPTDPGPMTVETAAPEQIRGEAITTATDVYALGQLLTKLLPKQSDLLKGHKFLEDLDCIMEKAKSPLSKDRYESAEQLAEEINRHLEDWPIKTRRSNWVYQANKFRRRRKLEFAAIALALLFVLVFGVVVTFLWQQARKERDLAARERDKAERMIELLEDIFVSSNPDNAKGIEITAREILQNSKEKIGETLKDDPETLADFATVIGRIYRNLGDYRASREVLEQALESRLDAFGGSHPQVAKSQNNLGTTLFKMEKFEQAAGYFEQALMIQRENGDDPLELARSLSNVGTVLYKGESYETAELRFREALAIQEEYSVDDPLLPVKTSMNLAALLVEQGKLREAEDLYRKNLQIRIENLGPNHTEVAKSFHSLGVLLRDQARYSEAEEMLQKALEIRLMLFGEKHPDVARVFNSLGEVSFKNKNFALAEQRYLKALGILGEIDNPTLTAKVERSLVELKSASEVKLKLE